MDRDLFLAILAMDSYNRGYGAGVNGLPASGQIGTATILTDAVEELDASAVQAAGFYAIAYDVSGVAGFNTGDKAISYRGTDNHFSWPFFESEAADSVNGYIPLATGDWEGPQPLLALHPELALYRR